MTRSLLLLLFIAYANISYSQSKTDHVLYNKLIELEGSPMVIATTNNMGKVGSKSRNVLFINTLTGENTEYSFDGKAHIADIKQIKIDEKQINIVIIEAQTIDLDQNNKIDWSDPRQLYLCSIDGKSKIQVTPDDFFTRYWMIHNETGNMVITGYYDTNPNGKYDYKDKNAILLYDIKDKKMIPMQ